MAKTFIDEVIAQFDCRTTPFELFDVRCQLIGASMGAQLSSEEQTNLDAEIAAFTLRFTNSDKSPWGTFFAPLRSEQCEGGVVIHDPDLARLDSKSVDVWARRAKTCANPVLTSRYADLIWDLEQKIVGHVNRRPEFARLAFDTYLRAVREERFLYPPLAAQALRRALEIAGEMHDSEKIAQATEAMLEFGKTAPAGLLAIFSKTLSTKNKLGSTTMNTICSLLEQRLTKVIAESHQMEVESAVHALESIYRKEKDEQNRQRIAKIYGAFYLRMAETARSTLAIGWLMPVVKLYMDVNLIEEADEVLLYMENRGSTAANEMGVISVEMSDEEAAKAEADANVAIDGWLATNDLFFAIFRASYSLLPDPDDIRKMLAQTAIDCPLMSSIPRSLIGSQGMPVATIGALEDDQEGRLVEMYVQLLQMNAPVLDRIWVKAKEKFNFTVEQLAEALRPSLLFESDRRDFFIQGFSAFDVADYSKSIHILIPQVENMMRKFLRVLGAPTIKLVRDKPGIVELKNLSDALSNHRVKDALEERLLLFLKVLYNDRRGYNLRNEVAHGIASFETFNRFVAAQVIQSIFLLSALRSEMCYIPADERRAMHSEQTS
jgi:lysyl-tRNA synthetase class 1